MIRVLVIIAFAIWLALGVLALLDGRAEVGVLSGTLPASDEQLLLGLAYAASWFAAITVAPILVIAALLLAFYRSRWCASIRTRA